jgi:CDP-glucose 4,6-dehydratase
MSNPPRKFPGFEHALTGRRVLVTGHTGFTGGWLTLWLHAIGAKVTGLALPPEREPNLFAAADIGDHLESRIGDIRDPAIVRRATEEAQPSVVFHLAAQPLVSRGFADPLATFATNVMGTANVLEAAGLVPGVKAVVCVTTDKVYADEGAERGHGETDRLGGDDPYGASKACAELVAAAYRKSVAARQNGVLIATARGGNIIGGGDWSDDRIVPDFVRAVTSGTPLTLRSPAAVRPWHHVLALVHGYLLLASRLVETGPACAGAWNFGPSDGEAIPVQSLVERLAAAWTRPTIELRPGGFPERQALRLDSTKARDALGWRPPLGSEEAIALTAAWYRDYYAKPSAARSLTVSQIDDYRQRLRGAP